MTQVLHGSFADRHMGRIERVAAALAGAEDLTQVSGRDLQRVLRPAARAVLELDEQARDEATLRLAMFLCPAVDELTGRTFKNWESQDDATKHALWRVARQALTHYHATLEGHVPLTDAERQALARLKGQRAESARNLALVEEAAQGVLNGR